MIQFDEQDGFFVFENADGQGIVAYECVSPIEEKISVATRKHQDKADLTRLVKRVLGNQFEWKSDEYGKPWPSDGKGHISLSHSRSHVAFSFHPHTNQGIDVEEIRPQLNQVANRILHSSELEMLHNSTEKQDLLQNFWGAKEAMYKAYGKKNLIFSTQLIISSINPKNAHSFNGKLLLENEVWEFELAQIRPDENCYLVFVKDLKVISLK